MNNGYKYNHRAVVRPRSNLLWNSWNVLSSEYIDTAHKLPQHEVFYTNQLGHYSYLHAFMPPTCMQLEVCTVVIRIKELACINHRIEYVTVRRA